jgi:hypothetical protein
LEQVIQCELGKATLGAPDVSSEDGEKEFRPEVPIETSRRATLNKTTVNGIPMVSDIPGTPAPKPESEEKEKAKLKEEIKPIMSKDEAEAVADTPDFKNFFMRASRLVERGLFFEIDVIGSFERLEIDEGDTTTTKDKKITERATFMRDNPVKRAITNLE